MVAHALTFLGVSAVVIVTPGQDTALTIRNTLLAGRRAGMLTAAGVASGQAFWTLAAGLGLAALLSASEPAFLAVRFAGAAYLVFLGLQTLLGWGHARRQAPGGRGAFRQGLLSNLGNPKMALFFTSLLPQFGGASFAALLGLGLFFCTMTLAWLSWYAAVVARVGDFLRRGRGRAWLDRVTGVVLIAFGLRLATETR